MYEKDKKKCEVLSINILKSNREHLWWKEFQPSNKRAKLAGISRPLSLATQQLPE